MPLHADAPIEITGRFTIAGAPPARRRYSTSLRRLANGDLLAAYYESADSENRNDGGTVITRSRDGGQNWDAPVTLYAEPGWNCGPVGGLKVLPDGTVLALIGKLQRTVSQATSYGLEYSKTETFVTRSTDHGYNWGVPERIAGPWAFLTEMYGPSDPFPLKDGRLMFCMQGTRETGGHGWESSVITTSDGLRSFSEPIIIATSPTIDFNDAALIRLADDRLLAMIRSENPPFHAYRSYSADEGATWTPPTPSGLLGQTLSVYRLGSGDIVCFYRDLEPNRPGVSSAVSQDGGVSWSWIGQIYESPDWFCGYPAAARLSDDQLVLIYFAAVVDGNADIQGVFLRDRSRTLELS